jgi:hypothetical protein
MILYDVTVEDPQVLAGRGYCPHEP